MSLKQSVHHLMPEALKQRVYEIYDRWSLMNSKDLSFDTSHLLSHDQISIKKIFGDSSILEQWSADVDTIYANIPADGRGGVNLGDGRAIYYLISALGAHNVLEIGTHIGVSTAHISCALQRIASASDRLPHLTTVDIVDVNDLQTKPWMKCDAERSPKEIVENLGNADLVEFVAQHSTDFLKTCQKKFDFIFLDGSHAAEMVYQETSLALGLLNHNGVILLHDYFPNLKPLWSNNAMIPGPFLAGKKIRSACDAFGIEPLGILPWQTKLGSNVTSLALVLRI